MEVSLAQINNYSHEIQEKWTKEQDLLRKRLIVQDDFIWRLPNLPPGEQEPANVLKYVGGVDVSFSKDDPSLACGAFVVFDLVTHQVVYEDYSIVTLEIPYLPGFLAFREAPIFLDLLEKMKNVAHPCYPQLLMVDGNGLLHPRGFGLACHLGILADLPTIGIGKNLHQIDGLTQSRVKQLLEANENCDQDYIPLRGDSGCIWGAAIRSTEGSSKPIFVSVGHRISLATAIEMVKLTCQFRVPEPIRQADIRSREYLRKRQLGNEQNKQSNFV
ncbi:endonuclease V [Impatiens glandulifera]|uniref:endonuclease V n=1 Tax=Impatiens glandulifera TaxID=253017 RepID=UPI001FB0AE8E|nr:endonuclease V [Impatiens glandulifera]